MLKRKRIDEDYFFTKRKKSSKEFQNQISLQQNQINFQQNQINILNNKLDFCINLLENINNQQKEIMDLLEPIKVYNSRNSNFNYFS